MGNGPGQRPVQKSKKESVWNIQGTNIFKGRSAKSTQKGTREHQKNQTF